MQQKTYIPRPRLLGQVMQFLEEAAITVLLGARQTGKTTLAQMVAQLHKENTGVEVHFFDLERAPSRAALSTPEITLDPLS
jgi:predicted AAA+ superfamily ATPase